MKKILKPLKNLEQLKRDNRMAELAERIRLEQIVLSNDKLGKD